MYTTASKEVSEHETITGDEDSMTTSTQGLSSSVGLDVEEKILWKREKLKHCKGKLAMLRKDMGCQVTVLRFLEPWVEKCIVALTFIQGMNERHDLVRT
jgi:hypothetical protein